jgi:hypothetical protein
MKYWFDDMDIKGHRAESDKLAAFREVFDIFATDDNCAPGTHVITDKQQTGILWKMSLLCLCEVETNEIWNENVENSRCRQAIHLE